jgi:folylpolyglutamate synthase/dihydropteroate synthase
LTTHLVAGREVLTDCSHNLEAATALAEHLQTRGRRYNLLFSCLDDKPVEEMAAVLRPVVGDVVVCSLDDERVMGLERLQAAFGGCRAAPDPLGGLEILDDPVLAAGSIRLVGRLIGASEGVD